MRFEAEVLEFPAFADLPKREKSKVQKVWDGFQELSKVTAEKGLLVHQALAARLLDVSPQRVSELVKENRLETYTFNGVPLVTENSVVSYAKGERRAGRPVSLPTTLKDAYRRAKRK